MNKSFDAEFERIFGTGKHAATGTTDEKPSPQPKPKPTPLPAICDKNVHVEMQRSAEVSRPQTYFK